MVSDSMVLSIAAVRPPTISVRHHSAVAIPSGGLLNGCVLVLIRVITVGGAAGSRELIAAHAHGLALLAKFYGTFIAFSMLKSQL
jgi:hypothetical protein